MSAWRRSDHRRHPATSVAHIGGFYGLRLCAVAILRIASSVVTHQPHPRGQPAAYRKTPQGKDVPDRPAGNTGLFEVVCPHCGDAGGPIAELPEDLQELRGPYPSLTAARAAAETHRVTAGDVPR